MGDVADLVGQVGGHEVDVVGQVLPGSRDAGDERLPAELALGPNLAGHARHLVGERRELIDHRVDRLLELEDLALDVDGDLLRQVAVGHRRRDHRDVAHLIGQVGRHEVDVVGQVAPGSGDVVDLCLAAELAVGADLTGHPADLGGEARQLVDHLVDRGADTQELALHRLPLDLKRHLLLQVSLGHRRDHPGHLGGGPHQVVDQRVDRFRALPPGSAGVPERRPLGHLALAPDHPRDALQLGGHPGVAIGQLVVGGGQLAGDAAPPDVQPGREVTDVRPRPRPPKRHAAVPVAAGAVKGTPRGAGALRPRADRASGGRRSGCRGSPGSGPTGSRSVGLSTCLLALLCWGHACSLVLIPWPPATSRYGTIEPRPIYSLPTRQLLVSPEIPESQPTCAAQAGDPGVTGSRCQPAGSSVIEASIRTRRGSRLNSKPAAW